MHPLIDVERQKKAKRYEKRKIVYGAEEVFLDLLYAGVFYLTGASGKAAAFASRSPLPLALLLYVLCFAPLWVMLFPVAFFKGYALDKEFGLSTMSAASWVRDHLKGLLVSAVFGYLLVLLLFYLFRRVPGFWWALGASGLSAARLLVVFVFPVFLLPLFFRQTPVEDPDLKNAVSRLLKKTGIGISGIYSFNMSAKSTRENAALAGIWKTRRILVADTLLAGTPQPGPDREAGESARACRDLDADRSRAARRSIDKVLAVVAHEAGHHTGRHMLQLSLLGLAASLATLYILHRVMGLFDGFPSDFPRTLSLAPVMALAAGAVSFPFRVALIAFARAKERDADERALALTGNPTAFMELMADLANTNLAVAYPKKLRVLLSYTHPPIGERISAAEGWELMHAGVSASRNGKHRRRKLP
jgi:STE24 endopeptidase